MSRLEKKGYIKIGSNIPYLTLLMKKEEELAQIHVVACMDLIHNVQMTPEQLENIGMQLEQKLLLEQAVGIVEILFVIYTDNLDRDKSYLNKRGKFWLADELGRQILIFENQPENFYGVKEELEAAYETEGKFQLPEIQLRPFPFVTMGLLLINVLVHIILEVNGNTKDPVYMLQHGAIYSGLVFDEGEYYRLFTAIFMHFGVSHLLNNMLALVLMGSTLERVLGRVYFSIIYLVSGVVGSLCSAIVVYYEQTLTVSAGASGAIYGVLGAIMVLMIVFSQNREKSVFLRLLLVLFLLMESDSGNIDVTAHISGFVAGMLVMILIYICDKFRARKLQNEV